MFLLDCVLDPQGRATSPPSSNEHWILCWSPSAAVNCGLLLRSGALVQHWALDHAALVSHDAGQGPHGGHVAQGGLRGQHPAVLRMYAGPPAACPKITAGRERQ